MLIAFIVYCAGTASAKWIAILLSSGAALEREN
jgi:hypothetical protein